MRSKLHIIIVHILLHTIDHYRFVSDDYKYIKEIVKLCSIFVSKTRADDFLRWYSPPETRVES